MTFKPEKPQDPEPRPGVEVGDHLYVHHKGQPCTGRVVSHGRHGVTVDIDKQHHKVKWDKVLGHKQRAQQRFSVVDQGEDGMLVEDAQGRRRFIGVPNESKEDPMVTKSAAARPVLLFTKSAPSTYVGGPGLQKKQVTDKNGVQTTRWVSVDRGGPPAQKGQHVGFENGEHKGHGQVVAAGRRGVTVKDAAGGEHRVHHEKITHHWQGEGSPNQSPHQTDEGKPSQPAGGDALFDQAHVDSLPDKVNQPVSTWEDLVKHGTEGLGQFKDMMGKVQQAMGLKAGMKPEDITPEQWENGDGFLFIAPLKGEKRAKEKVEADYKGDWSQLRDVVRGTISVPSMGHIKQALGHLKSVGIELAQKPKNRFEKPTGEGYRDLMTFVKLPNGMLAELQLHVKSMTLAKEKGHKDYEITRSLQGKYNEGEPSDKWSNEDHSKFYDALKRQKEIYTEAWNKANGSANLGDGKLIKSDQSTTLKLFFRRVSK